MCYFIDVAFYVPIVIFLFLILLVFGGDIFGILGLPAIAVAYMLKEYVLGFPDLILDPPSPLETDNELQASLAKHIGQVAITTSSLKPIGEIELNDVRLTAASESGVFIDPGTDVVIVGVKNGKLVVRENVPNQAR